MVNGTASKSGVRGRRSERSGVYSRNSRAKSLLHKMQKPRNRPASTAPSLSPPRQQRAAATPPRVGGEPRRHPLTQGEELDKSFRAIRVFRGKGLYENCKKRGTEPILSGVQNSGSRPGSKTQKDVDAMVM